MNYQTVVDDSLYENAARVIRDIKYINLATVTIDGKPWNTPVYCSYNDQLHFHWLSWKENQHSINIENNSSVFATLYDSTVPESTGFGIYFEGNAHKIEQIPKLINALAGHYGRINRKTRAAKLFLTSYPRRAYEFVPIRAWVNGDSLIKKQFVDVRHELDLTRLKQKLAEPEKNQVTEHYLGYNHNFLLNLLPQEDFTTQTRSRTQLSDTMHFIQIFY